MGAWSDFLAVTTNLDEAVHQKVTDQNRAEVLKEVARLLDERESTMRGLPQPANDEEQTIVQEVLQRDLKINQKLEFLFNGLKVDMRNMKKQKTSKQRYTNPYQSVSNYDGMFLDHKK